MLFELHQAYAADELVSGLKSYQHVSRALLEQFNIVEDSGQTTIADLPELGFLQLRSLAKLKLTAL